jgi:hypothetical protein
MREVAVSQSEAVHMINDEKLSAERREVNLKVRRRVPLLVSGPAPVPNLIHF